MPAFDPVRTPLAGKISQMIRDGGPLPVSDYFALCLSDPEFGYYATREPFGLAGDFTTAPEITQLFGEMIGIFLVESWIALGRPERPRLVEIGPGRATMMRDILRVIQRAAPDLGATMSVDMVETSDRLAREQQKTLQHSRVTAQWHKDLETVPRGATLLVANELFDALPLKQYVSHDGSYRERVVALDDDAMPIFALGRETIEPALLPDDAAAQAEGTIFEHAPEREAMMRLIADRLTKEDGVALIVDYGHVVSGYGDTLQAIHRQAFDHPLSHPGQADLTSHVDFEALARAARQAGAHVAGPAPQGEFLLGLGLLERAGRLGAGKTESEQQAIQTAVERIAGSGPAMMGDLFKVMAVCGAPVGLPPFRALPTEGAPHPDTQTENSSRL